MKKVLLALLLCLSAVAADAQSLRSLFMSAPDEVLPLLSENSRADCLDFFDAGMEARVTNRLDGKSTLRVLTDDYLFLQTTSASSLQIKMLHVVGGDSILCVVRSVKAEAEDSHVTFYDLSWKELPAASLFSEPSVEDFFLSRESAAEHIDKCDIYLVKYLLSGEEPVLVAEYTMPSYMDVDDRALVSPLLKRILYRWNGKRFVIEQS